MSREADANERNRERCPGLAVSTQPIGIVQSRTGPLTHSRQNLSWPTKHLHSSIAEVRMKTDVSSSCHERPQNP